MMRITFRILSFWRVGTGGGRGGALDAVCARDPDGMPLVPGRQVRGLLREAVRDGEALKWIDGKGKSIETLLFGSRQSGEEMQPQTRPGTLRFESALLPEAERQALRGNDDLIARLFAVRSTTAIDPASGTAMPRSLRAEEVAIPLTLEARVHPLPGAPGNWREHLQTALPLIRGLGSGRRRGLGRVIVTCNAEALS